MLLLAFLAAGVVAAQPRALRCAGQPIADVVIRSHAPSYGGLFARSRPLGRTVSSLHVATDPEVIRRYLLFRRGQRCDPLALAESERVLRSLPFLADARIAVVEVGVDSLRLEVVTLDEPAPIVSLGFQRHAPYVRALSLANANVGGRGVVAGVLWREGFAYRDVFGGWYRNYDFLDRPWQTVWHAAVRARGYELRGTVAAPLLSDLSRVGWLASASAAREAVAFRSSGESRRSLGVARRHAEAGALARLGSPAGFALLGGALVWEEAVPEMEAVFATDSGYVPDSTALLRGRYRPVRAARLDFILGYRNASFLRVTGFDALAGVQDVRRGVQVGFTLGRPLAGGMELYSAGDIYFGAGAQRSFAALQVVAEGWRSGSDWENVLVSGRAAWYSKPHPRSTLVAGLEYGGGFRLQLPMQLALGDATGGVRGYERAEVGGDRRMVLRLEERWLLGTVRGTADAGVAFFWDAGRVWAGGSPLASATPLRHAVGISFLAAIPPGSRRLWRADLAFPLARESGARWTLRVGSEDRTRAFWAEPEDVRRSRSRAAPLSAFVAR